MQKMISLLLRNLFFTLLQPGIVAGLIPYLLLGDQFHTTFHTAFGLVQWAGLIVLMAGFVLMMTCILQFAIQGKGTLSPADPTKKLVIQGPYKYSRNPMYLGVLFILAAESLFFQSFEILTYTIVILGMFQAFIVWVEEPRLRRDFPEYYSWYSRKVPRWF